jgi:hypothetical protein
MAKRKVNKSEKVREYIEEHPEAGPSEVSRALQEFGVTPALVSNIKSRTEPGRRKTKKRGAARRGRPRAAARNGVPRGRRPKAQQQGEAIVEAAKLIRLCGGIEGAKAALTTADQVVSALR